MAVYGLAAAGCVTAALRSGHRALPALVALAAVAWAATLAPRVVGRVDFLSMFGAFEMESVAIEEPREMYGLLLVAGWMAVVALRFPGREHAGRRLKAIPRHFITGGLSARLVGALDAGVYVTRASGVWLDDANTLPLNPYTRVDARLAWSMGGATLYLEARNLRDRRYSTTGFPDPAGTEVVYHHPAAGSPLSVGVRSGG